MKTQPLVIVAATVVTMSSVIGYAGQISGEHYTKVAFADDFSSGELGKSWKLYSAESRVEDGVLHAKMKPGHGAVQGVVIEPTGDVEVTVRFKAVDKNVGVQIAFNDRTYKEAHAGHICRVALTSKGVKFQDGKYGVFSNAVYDQKTRDGKHNDESKAIIAKHQKLVDFPITSEDWHTAVVRIKGDWMELSIDGKDVGGFRSPGIAHATKRHVAFVVGKDEMYLDDVSIRLP